MPLSDPTTRFKAIRGNILKQLATYNVNSDGYAFLIETKYFAWKNGFSIKELPIIFTERRNGQSKLNFSVKVQSAIRVMQLGFGRIWNFFTPSRFRFIQGSPFRLGRFVDEKKT